jgi:hypothetical protein
MMVNIEPFKSVIWYNKEILRFKMVDMKLHYVIAELHIVIVIFSIFYCCYALILRYCSHVNDESLLYVDAEGVYRPAAVILEMHFYHTKILDV